MQPAGIPGVLRRMHVARYAILTFDTDTEESEVFYQSYQTRQLSKESSDEFDF